MIVTRSHRSTFSARAHAPITTTQPEHRETVARSNGASKYTTASTHRSTFALEPRGASRSRRTAVPLCTPETRTTDLERASEPDDDAPPRGDSPLECERSAASPRSSPPTIQSRSDARETRSPSRRKRPVRAANPNPGDPGLRLKRSSSSTSKKNANASASRVPSVSAFLFFASSSFSPGAPSSTSSERRPQTASKWRRTNCRWSASVAHSFASEPGTLPGEPDGEAPRVAGRSGEPNPARDPADPGGLTRAGEPGDPRSRVGDSGPPPWPG